MLQRIQTVFLLLVIILMGMALFLPLWTHMGEGTDIYYKLTPFLYESFDTTLGQPVHVYFPYAIVGILAIASIIIAIIEVTRYSNRLLQMKLGALNSLLMAGTMCLGVYFATELMEEEAVTGGFGAGLFLPAAAMICNIIANRFIRKDERLVRSVDRIR